MSRRLFLLLLAGILAFPSFSQEKIRVACVGNSITEGRQIEEGHRYPDQLGELLGDSYDVRNYGIGGRTLLKHGDYPYRAEDKYQEVLAWKPEIVIIMLGTNDSKPQNWRFKDEFVSDYKAFIESFKALDSKPVIYICDPIPVFKDIYGITGAVVQDEIVPMVNRVGTDEHVKVIDCFTPMIGKGDLTFDGVHPNAEGAGIMAHAIFQSIDLPKK